MAKNIIEKFLKNKSKMSKLRRTITCLAAVVVFATTYALILPAMTLDGSDAQKTPGIDTKTEINVEKFGQSLGGDQDSGSDVADNAAQAVNSEEKDVSGGEGALQSEGNGEEAPEAAMNSEGEKANGSDSKVGSDNKANDVKDGAKKDTAGSKDSKTADDNKDKKGGSKDLSLITEKTEIKFDGKGYKVIAEVGADAKLPADTKLKVREIKKETKDEAGVKYAYDTYCDEALKAVRNKDGEEAKDETREVMLFDISFDSAAVEKAKAVGSDADEEAVKDAKAVLDKVVLDKDGNLEPAANVKVKIVFDEAMETSDKGNTRAVHFDKRLENMKDEEIAEVKKDVLETKAEGDKKSEMKEAEFKNDKFSVYGFVYTVDFAYEVNGKTYEFSMPGGGFVRLNTLMEVLGVAQSSGEEAAQAESSGVVPGGDAVSLNELEVSEATKEFAAGIEKVEFSKPKLVWVGKTTEDSTVGDIKEANALDVEYSEDMTKEQIEEINAQPIRADEWLLISMKPFDTEETLTISMKSGEAFMIKVTDAQANPFGLDGKTYSITAKKGNTNYYMNNEISSGNSNCLRGYSFDNSSNYGTPLGTAWTFEWTGNGKEYLIHDANNSYVIIENDKVRLGTKEQAQGNPIIVDSKEGKYSFRNRDNTGLNIYGGNGFGPWAYDYNNSDFWMTLQEPSNLKKPGTIETADTSGLLTINLFDYGPEDQLDKEANNNSNPANAGVNVDHALKFFSYGKNVGTGINDFTGNSSVRQGIVADELGADKYPYLDTSNSEVSSAESLGYLFGAGNNGVTPYTGVNHLFTLDDDGYYHYDSNDNYAYLNTSTKDFKVYSKTFPEEGADDKYFGVGFFPFNDYDEYYNCIHGKSGFERWDPHTGGTNKAGHYNHHFGMSITGNFIMPPDGLYNGKHVTYDFSGDDDMWVFIDGVLILDIGGIHNPASGSIDFTDGTVMVNGAEQTNLKEKYKQVTGRDWDDSDFSNHDFRVFYMERGGMYSNLEVTFNLPLTEKTETGDFDFDKVSSLNEDMKLANAKFALFTDNDCETPFTLATVPVEATSGENGVVSFKNIPYGTYYMKETEYPTGYQAKNPEEIFIVEVGASGATIKNASGTEITKVTNEPKKIDVEVEKKWKNGNAPDDAKVEIVLGRYKLVEDPNAQGTGTLVIKDSYSGLPQGTAYHVTYTITGPENYTKTIAKSYTKENENIEISVPDLPAGVEYTVSKQVGTVAHHDINNGSDIKTVIIPKKGSASVTFDQSTFARNAYRVRIYAVNNQNQSNTTLYSEDYYQKGKALSIRMEHNAYNWGFFNFTVTSSTDWTSNTFTSDSEQRFTNSLNSDIDLYVRCSDSGWNIGYNWIKNPSITGASPVRAAKSKMAMKSIHKSTKKTTATAPTLPEPPKDTIYELDSDYAENPDKITLENGIWTGKAEGLDASNEYGPYVYYIAEVNESGIPSSTTVEIADDITFDGSSKKLIVTNTLPDEGDLKLIKVLVGIDINNLSNEQKEAITFNITGPNEYSNTVKLSEFTGLEKTITGLTPGEYTVVETVPDISVPNGYRLVSTTYNVESRKVNVPKGGSAEVTITNKYEKLTEITVMKVDKDKKAKNADDPERFIDGAIFSLLDGEGHSVHSIESIQIVNASSGEEIEYSNDQFTLPIEGVKIKGLPNGTYILREEKAPAGYVIENKDTSFTVRDGNVVGSNTAIFEIENTPGAALPSAGGPGTTWIYLLGAMLTLGAGMAFVIRRRLMCG